MKNLFFRVFNTLSIINFKEICDSGSICNTVDHVFDFLKTFSKVTCLHFQPKSRNLFENEGKILFEDIPQKFKKSVRFLR